MNNETKSLVNHRIARANETLEDAKILFENGRLFSTVNRIYYAISALLMTRNLGSSKHSGVLGLFNKEFIKKGVVDKELGKFYNAMFEFRQKADYQDLVKFKREDISLWLDKATGFIVQIKNSTRSGLNS